MSAERFLRLTLLASVTLTVVTALEVVPTPIRAFALAWLIAGVLTAWPNNGVTAQPWPRRLLVALVALTVVALVRGYHAQPGLLNVNATASLIAGLVALTTFTWASLLSRNAPESRVLYGLLSPVVFVAVNLLAHLAGRDYTGTAYQGHTGESTMLALVGRSEERVGMALTPGLNGAGAIAAVALAITIPLLLRSRGRQRRTYAVLALLALVTIAKVDSRGALLSATLAVLIVALLPRMAKRYLAAFPFVLPFAPHLIISALQQLSGVAGKLSREPGDFATATGRGVIWDEVIGYLSHPHATDLIGYGSFGQVTSGVSFSYADMFFGRDRGVMSAHNALLQATLDMGYVGAGCLLAVFVVLLREGIRRLETPYGYGAVSGIVALMLVGTTEALPSVYFVPTLASLLVLGHVVARNPVAPRIPAPARPRYKQTRAPSPAPEPERVLSLS